MMNEGDPQAWRERVTISLATIETQLKRIAADRESEKGTLRRFEERVDKHIEWNDKEHGEHRERHSKLEGKVNIVLGIGLALNSVALIAVAVIGWFIK